MSHSSEPKTTAIFIQFLLAGILLFFACIGLLYYFQVVKQRQIRAKIELAPPIDLRSLRAQEDTQLHQEAWVDRQKGIVRIPIERAMELEVARPWRQDPRFSILAPPVPGGERRTTDALTTNPVSGR